MDWIFGNKFDSIDRSFALGEKFFICTIPREELESGELVTGQKSSSGYYAWVLTAIKKDKKLKISLKCELESICDGKSSPFWSVHADHQIRLRNFKTGTRKTRAGATKFNASSFWTTSEFSFNDIAEDSTHFIFVVEIGINSENIFPEKDNYQKPKDDCVLLIVNGSNFYVPRGVLVDNSKVFAEHFKENESMHVKDVDEECFLIFLNYLHTGTLVVQPDKIEEFIKLSLKFDVNKLTLECEKCLEKAVMDVSEKVKLADKYKFQNIVTFHLQRLKTIKDIKSVFKHYCYFSKETNQMLIEKLCDVT